MSKFTIFLNYGTVEPCITNFEWGVIVTRYNGEGEKTAFTHALLNHEPLSTITLYPLPPHFIRIYYV